MLIEELESTLTLLMLMNRTIKNQKADLSFKIEEKWKG